jgi:hypothetical protein
MNQSHHPFVKLNRLAPLALAAFLASSPAWSAEPDAAIPSSYPVEAFPEEKFALRLGSFLVTDIQTTIGLHNDNTGQGGDFINFGDTLGVETSVNIFRADADWYVSGPHLVQASWYDINLTGHRTLDREIHWGDETFPVNATLDSGFRTQIYKLSYGYTFHRGERHEFTALIGAHIMSLETSLSAPSLGRAERFEVTAPLPAIGLGWNAHWTPRFQTRATVQYFGISIEDKIEGHFVDALLSAEYRLNKNFSVGAGYNYFDLNIDAHKGPLTLSVTDSYQGFLAYVGVHF